MEEMECPICHYHLTESDYTAHYMDGGAYYDCYLCPNCESEGREVYELHFVGHIVSAIKGVPCDEDLTEE